MRLCQRAPIVFQQDDARVRPQTGQCIGIVTQCIGTIQRFAGEGVTGEGRGGRLKTCHGTRQAGGHMLKLLPQPQVVLALGLRMTNCAPCRLSL